MIEAVSRSGYAQTTVAHVIKLAGVSRRAFYEQFTSKEDCFLATYDVVVSRERKRAIDVWGAERGWDNRVHAACKRLFDDVGTDPRGARLVLVDSVALGPTATDRARLVSATFERLLSDAFSHAPDSKDVSPLAARAIVAGVRHIVLRRLVESRERELLTITDEILDWIESYRSCGVPAIALTAPPPARPRLAQRMPVRGAGIGSVIEALLDDARMAVRPPVMASPLWPRAVRFAIASLTEFIAENEALLQGAGSHVELLEPHALIRVTEAIEDLTGLSDEGAAPPQRGPGVAREAVAGAVWSIIAGCIARGRAARLPYVADQLAFIVLAPYLGARAAAEQIRSDGAALHAV